MLDVSRQDIETYLFEVKKAIKEGNYRIARNKNRLENLNLFLDYVIDEVKAKEILLSLNVSDFSHIVNNEHAGYEHELLYIFGKDVCLLERIGEKEKIVSLYIKFNNLNQYFVIVISFHEQNYPLNYPFR